MIEKCPNCNGELVVTSYKCRSCGTEVSGYFEQDKFAKLTSEEKDFIELFLRKRGSIKEVGEAMGISYPTVRNKIDRVVKSLGGKVDKEESRIDILNMLKNGDIDANQAKELLKEIQNE
ncbi:MAG: DUF2089 domain-containing protein [Tissierellia bacterium]|nr:DUF2089 domain-containing protein [Tissierellia bacterium]